MLGCANARPRIYIGLGGSWAGQSWPLGLPLQRDRTSSPCCMASFPTPVRGESISSEWGGQLLEGFFKYNILDWFLKHSYISQVKGFRGSLPHGDATDLHFDISPSHELNMVPYWYSKFSHLGAYGFLSKVCLICITTICGSLHICIWKKNNWWTYRKSANILYWLLNWRHRECHWLYPRVLKGRIVVNSCVLGNYVGSLN